MPRQRRLLRAMTNGFAPIRLEDYVERHLRSNPETKREDLIDRLHHAIAAFRRGSIVGVDNRSGLLDRPRSDWLVSPASPGNPNLIGITRLT